VKRDFILINFLEAEHTYRVVRFYVEFDRY
jgi:hypothetical protein